MASRKVVYIRTDGNDTIATGHLMRCLSIARALIPRNALPVFLLSDSTSISMLQKMQTPQEQADHTFPIINMQTDYRDLDREIPTLQNILSTREICCLLVDSYFATEAYLTTARKFCRIAYLDDLQAFDPPADLVINYDIVVDTSRYKNAQKILVGGSYTPLRTQFSLCPYRLWEEVRDVFISTGGTDPFNIAGTLTRQLLATPGLENVCFHVLTNTLHAYRTRLSALAEKESRIQLHKNISDMAALMAECDLAISAAGTTLYELCAIGVPTVSYTMSDNQIPGARAFEQTGLIPCIGDVRDNPAFFDLACEKLSALAKDPAARRQQSLRMRMAVDGAGADRIAVELLSPPPA